LIAYRVTEGRSGGRIASGWQAAQTLHHRRLKFQHEVELAREAGAILEWTVEFGADKKYEGLDGRSAERGKQPMKQVLMLIALLAFAVPAAGQTADDYRGGWRTDGGQAHTYEFSIRGATVRGIYCTYCADATTLIEATAWQRLAGVAAEEHVVAAVSVAGRVLLDPVVGRVLLDPAP